MKAIETLLAAGFDVRLIHGDGFDVVEAKRTDAATLTPRAAGELVKVVLQHPDEAVAFMREQLKADWIRLACGLDGATDVDEAIAIHELALLDGHTECSDGTTHRANINRLLGSAVHALAPATGGRITRPVHSLEPVAA